MKKVFIVLFILILVFVFGKSLLPGGFMFTFHDQTQPARIAEFTYNLEQGQIPPRIAPHMSFGLGYPVFSFYAPFSYWISTVLHLLGFDILDGLKLSFLIAVLLAFGGMYYLLRRFFGIFAAVFGSVLYAASPYMAVEIFVRGNLGEVWFLALLPWSLALFYMNTVTDSPIIFILSVLIASFTLSVHNIFSFIYIPMALVFILLLTRRKKNLSAYILSILSAAYFLIPFIIEASFTNATKVAELFSYKDHFLCTWQLWTTLVLGYGASMPGCYDDGMSFMLGKIQIIFGIIGLAVFLYNVVKKKESKYQLVFAFIAIIGIGSSFMTTYSSAPIWNIFKFLAVFQFPWRFLLTALFAISFMGAYAFARNPYPITQALIPFLILFIFISQSKYFYKQPLTKQEFSKDYLSTKYIHDDVAYMVSEYLPTTANYYLWRSIQYSPALKDQVLSQTTHAIYPLDKGSITPIREENFSKEIKTNSDYFLINVHYLPYWKIYMDGREYFPTHFDLLGRPVIGQKSSKSFGSEKDIKIVYQQTTVEIISNIITLLGIGVTILVAYQFVKSKKVSPLLSKSDTSKVKHVTNVS